MVKLWGGGSGLGTSKKRQNSVVRMPNAPNHGSRKEQRTTLCGKRAQYQWEGKGWKEANGGLNLIRRRE